MKWIVRVVGEIAIVTALMAATYATARTLGWHDLAVGLACGIVGSLASRAFADLREAGLL